MKSQEVNFQVRSRQKPVRRLRNPPLNIIIQHRHQSKQIIIELPQC